MKRAADCRTEKRAAAKKRVFVNCSFSERRRPIFDAVFFALACCGMEPVIAPSRADDKLSRAQYIVREMKKCWWSIHDITPTRGADHKIRFNTVFELGVSFGAGRSGSRCVFVRKKKDLGAGFSDLDGVDIVMEHGGAPEKVAKQLARWLARASGEAPDAAGVRKFFVKHRAKFIAYCKKAGWERGDDLSHRAELHKRWFNHNAARLLAAVNKRDAKPNHY